MIGAFPVDGVAVALGKGAVVCPKAATTLSKTHDIMTKNLTLDSFIRGYDAPVGLFVTNKDAFSRMIPLLLC
jgi:hypothetical protein